MAHDYDAVVVGAGPNGLAAAIVLAESGYSTLVVEAGDKVGGGCRTSELTLPGFGHDVCSTAHPLGRGSPLFRRLPLARYGLRWVHPPAVLAHPLDSGEVVLLHRSIAETAAGLGVDGERYRRRMETINGLWPELEGRLLGSPLRSGMSLGTGRQLASFSRSASRTVRRFRTPAARALFAGAAAHLIKPLEKPLTAGVGWLLLVMGHRYGWPFVEGGSQRLADALAAYLQSKGGEIETGRLVRDLGELPSSKVVLADVAPGALVGMLGGGWRGDRVRVKPRFRHGPGVFKLDWALSGPVPWRDRRMGTAGVVHLGGGYERIADTERTVWSGRVPDRPFVVAAQPSLFDPARAPSGMHTLWAYAHVPAASPADVRALVEAEIERHAPGFGETIMACHTIAASQWESYNPNYVGGDIGGGVVNLRGMLRGPFGGLSPYATGEGGLYLCSSSTPPGGGVHGMCGVHAARAALERLRSA